MVLLVPVLLCFAVQRPAHFRAHTIATGLKGGYQVVSADLNHDGKPDLIALASDMDELVWFENSTWERHVIARGFKGMINLAARDLDGDGIPEIVLASGFAGPGIHAGDTGLLTLLQHNGDPRQPWKATRIGYLLATHRIRWATIAGKPALIDASLTSDIAHPPDFAGSVPLVVFYPGKWSLDTISDENEGIMHGLCVTDWDGDGSDDILTASFLGIHLFRLGKTGKWTRTEISKGDPSPWPKSGASEIVVGHRGRSRFLSSIEPWHGNEVVVYQEHKKRWRRQVIDSSLRDGHTLLTVDLNGDHNDEIVAGFRATKSVIVYYAKGSKWSGVPLDAGDMAASSCVATDLNGDARPDIACIGTSTANLKWYENLGTGPQ